MVVDGSFYNSYERGLLGKFSKKLNILELYLFRTISPLSRAEVYSLNVKIPFLKRYAHFQIYRIPNVFVMVDHAIY